MKAIRGIRSTRFNGATAFRPWMTDDAVARVIG